MPRSLAWKALAVVPLFLASTALVFAALRLLPGDPVLSILAGSRHTEATREALRRELGLDRPLAEQYVQWLGSMARGEFGGVSLELRVPITSLVGRQVSVTVLLTLYTLAVSILVAVPLGVAAAAWKGRWPDLLIRSLALGGSSVPLVLLAFVAILALLRVLRWTPPIVYAGPLEDPRTHAQMMLVPVLLLSWEYGAHLLRVTRAATIEALASPAALAARARGIPRRQILVHHALRMALVPTTASMGVRLGALLGGALVVETVFGLPGVGRGVVRAALARDYPVVECLAAVLVLFGLLADLAMEALHRLLDPRQADGA
jgi:peptide/nickel transport system permease protein